MDFSFLQKTKLFSNLSDDEINTVLKSLKAYVKDYKKDEAVYLAGDCVDFFGMIISGGVNIERYDVWGNKTILSHVQKGQIFAETYVCLKNEPLMVSVFAAKDTKILFLNPSGILNSDILSNENEKNCFWIFVKNLLEISSQKNLNLSKRIFHTSPKTIRTRLMSYFSEQTLYAKSKKIEIPFDRQQLADYLGVDRSALSNELSKMQKDGLIKFRKNKFELIDE